MSSSFSRWSSLQLPLSDVVLSFLLFPLRLEEEADVEDEDEDEGEEEEDEGDGIFIFLRLVGLTLAFVVVVVVGIVVFFNFFAIIVVDRPLRWTCLRLRRDEPIVTPSAVVAAADVEEATVIISSECKAARCRIDEDRAASAASRRFLISLWISLSKAASSLWHSLSASMTFFSSSR